MKLPGKASGTLGLIKSIFYHEKIIILMSVRIVIYILDIINIFFLLSWGFFYHAFALIAFLEKAIYVTIYKLLYISINSIVGVL